MTTLHWHQHRVGDAGFLQDTTRLIFLQPKLDGPLFFVPAVKGAGLGDIARELIANGESRDTDIVVHHPEVRFPSLGLSLDDFTSVLRLDTWSTL